jgi:hypothetical protein
MKHYQLPVLDTFRNYFPVVSKKFGSPFFS